MREALTAWAVREDLTEEVTWSWRLKEAQEFASREGEGRPRWEKSRGEGRPGGGRAGPPLFIQPTPPIGDPR